MSPTFNVQHYGDSRHRVFAHLNETGIQARVSTEGKLHVLKPPSQLAGCLQQNMLRRCDRLSVREQSDDVEANTCRCDILLLFHLSLIFTKVSRRLFSTPCFSHLMYRSPTHCFKTQVLSCPSHIPP